MSGAAFELTAEDEHRVLNFDPWGERDATYVTLRDGFAVTRKPHACAICGGLIATRERVRAKTETDDGQIATFRFCAECCWCIAHRSDETDEDPHLGMERCEQRWEIGRQRAGQRQAAARGEGQA